MTMLLEAVITANTDDLQNTANSFTNNHILNASIAGFLIAQALKVIIVLITMRKLDFRRLVGSGGMPSSHAATVCAMAAAAFKLYGVTSPYFAIAAVTAAVVMYDASNVRRAAGEQAKILNYMMDNWATQTPDMFGKELKELLGHTPLEVFVGALLGIAIGMAV